MVMVRSLDVIFEPPQDVVRGPPQDVDIGRPLPLLIGTYGHVQRTHFRNVLRTSSRRNFAKWEGLPRIMD